MTPDLLRRTLSAHPPGTWPTDDRADALLAEVERAAEERPHDRRLARLAREVARLASADRGLDLIVAGVRRERLVRWDEDSTTWAGVDLETGGQALVRVLRPAVDEPSLRRALSRDARVLAEVIEGVRLDGVAIAAPAPGAPLEGITGTVRVARVLGTVLDDLAGWQALGLGLPPVSPEEVRADEARGYVVCLTPVHAPDLGDTLAWLAGRFAVSEESALARLLAGLRELPPYGADEAIEALRAALAEDLSGRRHALARRRELSRHLDRMARLHRAVEQLRRSVPPPIGRGAVGVDLDGRITVVEARSDAILWGPRGELEPFWTREAGFDAAHARRMLRARAAAPPNPRLDAEVGGDPELTDAIGRWTAAALRLRTVRLLLRKAIDAIADAPSP